MAEELPCVGPELPPSLLLLFLPFSLSLFNGLDVPRILKGFCPLPLCHCHSGVSTFLLAASS